LKFFIKQFRVLAFAALALQVVHAGIAHAEIFRCTDSDGHVVFTQQRCASTQTSEKVDMEGLNDVGGRGKPGEKICKDVKKLANLIFPHINQTDSILDIYSDLGGRENLSAGITAVVNYVFNFHYNPKARQVDVVNLTYSKCLDGGFGRITQRDLPDWDKIKYAREKEQQDKASTEQKQQQARQCEEYRQKREQLQRRMAGTKDKSARLQARVDWEYNEQQLKNKCGPGQAK